MCVHCWLYRGKNPPCLAKRLRFGRKPNCPVADRAREGGVQRRITKAVVQLPQVGGLKVQRSVSLATARSKAFRGSLALCQIGGPGRVGVAGSTNPSDER